MEKACRSKTGINITGIKPAETDRQNTIDIKPEIIYRQNTADIKPAESMQEKYNYHNSKRRSLKLCFLFCGFSQKTGSIRYSDD